MILSNLRVATFAVLIMSTAPLYAYASEPTANDRVISLKAVLSGSQDVLRQYEWVETMISSQDGDEMSLRRFKCYYGADWTVIREPIAEPAVKPGINDLRFQIPEEKSQDLSDQIQKAVSLIQQYIPLNPNGIKAITDDGKLSYSETDPGKRGRLAIRDFLKRGDRVELDLDLETNNPLFMKINSYFELQSDSVTLSVTFGSLYGTATFIREVVLEDRGRKLKTTIRASEFKKTDQ